MQSRAYTQVRPGTACIGNRWFERCWSAFVGNTIGLTQQSGPHEWAQGDGVEFHVACKTGTYGVMELGDIEWSEECTPHAAGLVLRKESPEGLGVTVLTQVFHDFPGQLRRVRVFNTGRRVFDVVRVIAESLPLSQDGVQVMRADRDEAFAPAFREGFHLAGIIRGNRGLLLGIDGDGGIAAFDPDKKACSLVVEAGRTLLPGGFWDLPPMLLIPFTGDIREAAPRLVNGFHERADSMYAWESRRLKVIPSGDSPAN